jgi:peptidoglycan/LPS O-acetylase OafA/YrhL
VWDGVRAIAMMWVVIGHTYEMSIVGGSNLLDFKAISVKPFLLVLEAGIFSVDIFFSLGGFFLAFILLRNKITGQVCGFGILQRALRIWPAYILAMMFYYSLLPKVGSGIFWGLVQRGTDICSTMWREVLFLSNFIENGERSCMPWGWYLQVDFQLFVAGIFLLYLYSKDRRYFTAATIFLGIASTVFVFVYGQIHNVKMTADLTAQAGTDVFNDTYIKPHARCVPYLMGLLLGAYFMEYRNELKSQPDGEERSTLLWRVRQYFLRHDKVRIVV